MSSLSLTNSQNVARLGGGRKAKKVHNNEYNHDMEKHLIAHQNQSEFIPHESFLKKFSTRTQHAGESSQPQLALIQSHSSLAVEPTGIFFYTIFHSNTSLIN